MNAVSPKAAWTGGQYSLVRAVVSMVLAWLAIETAFTAGELWYFPASLAIAAMAFGAGAGGRALALTFASLLPFSGISGTDSYATTVAAFWLLLHLGLPLAPFGSLAAQGRESPAGDWAMPGWYPICWQVLFVVTRMAAAMQAAMDGQTWLAAAFALPAVLALAPTTALAAWSISLAVELYVVIGGVMGGDGSLAAACLLHMLAFQPAWLPRRDGDGSAVVFYDGECALCHGAVRFLLAEDVDPPRFRIAPLQGPTFVRNVPERVRVTRPDSIVVARGNEVLLRGDAVIAILDILGGLWRMVASFLTLLPRGLLNSAYDAVAARRRRWFGRATGSCPLMPATLRSRIEP